MRKFLINIAKLSDAQLDDLASVWSQQTLYTFHQRHFKFSTLSISIEKIFCCLRASHRQNLSCHPNWFRLSFLYSVERLLISSLIDEFVEKRVSISLSWKIILALPHRSRESVMRLLTGKTDRRREVGLKAFPPHTDTIDAVGMHAFVPLTDRKEVSWPLHPHFNFRLTVKMLSWRDSLGAWQCKFSSSRKQLNQFVAWQRAKKVFHRGDITFWRKWNDRLTDQVSVAKKEKLPR